MQVELIKRLSDNVEQPDTRYGKYYDYFLSITDCPHEGTLERIVVNTATQGGFRLRKWKLHLHNNIPILKVYMEVSIMGHDLDQWVNYDMLTGERLDKPEST